MEAQTLSQLRPRLNEALAIRNNQLLPDRIVDGLEGVLEKVNAPVVDATVKRVDELIGKEGYYVLRDDDFPWLTRTASSVLGLVKANLLGVVPGLVSLLYKYRRNGAEITARQGAIVLTLRKAPTEGWSAAELFDEVEVEGLTVELIEAELQAVQATSKRSGKPGDFVVKIGARWQSRV